MDLTNTREISHILVCIGKGLKPVAIDSKISRDFSPKHKPVVHPLQVAWLRVRVSK